MRMNENPSVEAMTAARNGQSDATVRNSAPRASIAAGRSSLVVSRTGTTGARDT